MVFVRESFRGPQGNNYGIMWLTGHLFCNRGNSVTPRTYASISTTQTWPYFKTHDQMILTIESINALEGVAANVCPFLFGGKKNSIFGIFGLHIKRRLVTISRSSEKVYVALSDCRLNPFSYQMQTLMFSLPSMCIRLSFILDFVTFLSFLHYLQKNP